MTQLGHIAVASPKIVKELLDSLSRRRELGSTVRRVIKNALVVCLAVTAVAVVLFASLWLWMWYRTAQVEGFYREHPLFSEMRAGQQSSTNDSPPAREALLKMVPLGTDHETAFAVLRREGLGCQTIAEPITDTRLRRRFLEDRDLVKNANDGRAKKDYLDCQATTPNVLGEQQWIVNLEFDADGTLSDAGVAIWNIFL
jgi:hypothetical protein